MFVSFIWWLWWFRKGASGGEKGCLCFCVYIFLKWMCKCRHTSNRPWAPHCPPPRLLPLPLLLPHRQLPCQLICCFCIGSKPWFPSIPSCTLGLTQSQWSLLKAALPVDPQNKTVHFFCGTFCEFFIYHVNSWCRYWNDIKRTMILQTVIIVMIDVLIPSCYALRCSQGLNLIRRRLVLFTSFFLLFFFELSNFRIVVTRDVVVWLKWQPQQQNRQQQHKH